LPPGAKSIELEDDKFILPPDFAPKHSPGLHLPEETKISAINIFELFFDSQAIDMVIQLTLSYAEHNKEKGRYAPLMRSHQLLMAILGVLILLGIHNVRKYGVFQKLKQ